MERLCKDKQIGRQLVPIVPDESRTFGMEAMFRPLGIYAHAGQVYQPVDSDQFLYYKEARDGQILEEGITEAGSMASFIAAGTAYSQHGINMIPFFIYYSMFGFQRIGDLIWAASDCRAKGFLIGATAGRTTLNGEGLQHQDGHSHLNAIAFPLVRAYDPAFHYETAYIVLDGLRRLYQEGETAIYYITVHNENYEMPAMPDGVTEGIVQGIYKFRSREVDGGSGRKGKDVVPRVQLFGSGAILRCVLEAQTILAEKFQVASDVWSVTSFTQLRREAHRCMRWNLLHPDQPARASYIERMLSGVPGPIVAASDNVRSIGEQLAPFISQDYFVLGTDGMGRSDTREALRRHFEVDAACIVVAALHRLALAGAVKPQMAARAIRELDVNPEKTDPLFA
jgi:pyruvate dehydrogenase E1 component